jgi:hypothetical protein
MAIEAPISKFRKNNLKIYIVVCLALAFWCIYDAYFNEEFRTKYTEEDGSPKGWLIFNRNAPIFLFGAALLLAAYHYSIRNKKLIADENELIISDRKRIPYDSIQRINKTYFDSKGYFTIIYKNKSGREVSYKLDNKAYDNISAVLDHLVAEIT